MSLPSHWAHEAFFYHIYPLGMCGAPLHNLPQNPLTSRLQTLHAWLPHLKTMGVNAVYIGPLWESTSHGYDTLNYHQVDKRLGHSHDLSTWFEACHQAGIRVVVDAVFNHVGRHFFAFESIKKLGKDSPYVDWFENLQFGKRNRRGDAFTYEGWKGHDDLVKLNLQNPEVQHFIFEVVRYWINTFHIDGLRLDAADCMDKIFLKRLLTFCKKLRPDFWLMGEVVMGDYREWGLDAITNYELYDSFHKSHNAYDYTRLAQTLERQFGAQGVYKSTGMFNFLDNHDVNRIASLLKKTAHIYPLHLLLFTLPGTPCLYYGSEVGLEGKRLKWSDRPLRPFLPNPESLKQAPHQDLLKNIQRLAQLRKQHPALIYGSYKRLHVEKHVLIYERRYQNDVLWVMVNLSAQKKRWSAPEPPVSGQDILNQQAISFSKPVDIYPNWGRIVKITP